MSKFLDPLDPEGSPLHKLIARRTNKRLQIGRELPGLLQAEGLDAETSEAISRAFSRVADREDREMGRVVNEIEEWANIHTHDVGLVMMACGGNGLILRTKDTVTWDEHSSFTTQALWGLAKGQGRWVAVGQGPVIGWSDDEGITWQGVSSVPGGNLRHVTYSSELGIWCAVGFQATILTSSDGESWTQRSAPSSYTAALNHVAWGGGLFLASGPDGVIYSSDGTSWSHASENFDDSTVGIVEYMDGWWIAGSGTGIWSTQDPSGTWVQRESNLEGQLWSVESHGGTWVVGGTNETIMYSQDPDAENWTPATMPSVDNGDWMASGIAYAGRWIAVGPNWAWSAGPIISSNTGMTWQNVTEASEVLHAVEAA